MNNDKYNMLFRFFTRLCCHAGLDADHHSIKRERFISSLIAYPEDMICAAYQYLSHYVRPGRIPTESDFITFMTPECKRREMVEVA